MPAKDRIPVGFYVYEYFEPGFSYPFYVGKGYDRRAWDHLKPYILSHALCPFHKKVKALLRDGYSPEIMIIQEDLTELEAISLEVSLIKSIGRKDLGLGPLLNRTNGGEGITGLIHSEETKQRLREVRKLQRPWTEEECLAISERMKGNTYGLGRIDSDSTRQKKSQAQYKRRKSAIVGEINGYIRYRFSSRTEAKRNGYHVYEAMRSGVKYCGCYWREE